ncbi:MgtC/SapB family protein [Methylocella sp. CPCC 101449]|uniref:MgtC/SapB family protein n=1 Tax=Methylocella sp. CPCC 101449 TaxID=2987531 RepID=UPI00288D9EAD|nr:MgtC/SapB family protein [Methylocella sp. CPCC 101449]MDT2019377.1 MgtC/SapB family protein [Methylocella sp. CPCC 101449]
MLMGLEQATLNLAVAFALGALIGFERQWRQRLAGLRTNTLVSLGAATFVMFASLIPGEGSPTRVAAQVVSGIGFLGAGVIFKEGLNVRGLNTAATLWCSAAVGLVAGAGYPLHALLATAFVIMVNLALRPLTWFLSRHTMEMTELSVRYTITAICRNDGEANIRALMLQGFTSAKLHLHQLRSSDIEDSDRVEVTAIVTADRREDTALEHIVGRLSLEPSVTAARWRAEAVDMDMANAEAVG